MNQIKRESNVRKARWNGWFRISLALGFGASVLHAQGPPTFTTCTAPPAAQSFSIERAVMPSDTETTDSTAIPETILASLAAGTMEMREQLLYNPQANALTSTIFLVQAGSPIPTPPSVNLTSETLASFTLSIDRTYSSCTPMPSLMYTGTITSSSAGAAAPNGIYNLIFSGASAAVSIGYTNTNPPMVNNVVTLIAGVAVSYSAAGYGTLTFPSSVPGQPTVTSVVNSASQLPMIAPNSFVTIFGSNLSSKTDNWNNSIVNGALPTMLDGVSVSIGGQPAYISYVSAGQINVLAPQITSGAVTVTVTSGSTTSYAFTVTANQYAPALFAWPGNQAVATHLDGTYAVKAGTFPGLTTTPAKPGETITLWGTGFGPTTPATPAGMVIPSTQTYNTITLPTATLNNSEITVLGAALTPNSAGLYQVNVQIPSPLADGDYPVQVSIGGMTSPVGLILSVQQ